MTDEQRLIAEAQHTATQALVAFTESLVELMPPGARADDLGSIYEHFKVLSGGHQEAFIAGWMSANLDTSDAPGHRDWLLERATADWERHSTQGE